MVWAAGMERTVLVTGANSGLGRATCRHLADLGFRVVGTARSEDRLDVLAKEGIEGAVLDVTDRAGCQALVDKVEPWGLVNNAGHMNLGRVVDVDPDEALGQLDALVVAPCTSRRWPCPTCGG